MSRSIASELMKRGNARERQFGRMLSRGRVHGLPSELQMALSITDKIIKDFGGAAAGAMQGGDVYTPTPANNPPPRRRKSRLESNDK